MKKLLRLIVVFMLIFPVMMMPPKQVEAQALGILYVQEDIILDGASDFATTNLNGGYLYEEYTYLEMNGTYNWACRSFLKFDLSGVSSEFGPATQLRIPIELISIGTVHTIGLYSVADNWDETLVTAEYANNPANGLGDIALLDTAPAPLISDGAAYLIFEGPELANYLNEQASPTGDKTASFSMHFHSSTSTDMLAMIIFRDKENSPANDPPAIVGFDPTATALNDFDIVVENDALALNWQSGTEIDLAGFNLYRASTPAGQRVRLNDDLIPAKYPGLAEGGAYWYIDRQVQAGKYYHYWLEMVAADGTVVLNGPFSQLLPRRYYLPWIGLGFK